MGERVDFGFSYREAKDKKVFLYWENRMVMILPGKRAVEFLTKVEQLDENGKQLLMAKVTGNFKRGNERQIKESDKN